MDELFININAYLPFIIEAFVKVYGDEYDSIIAKRINETIVIQYLDPKVLQDYINYIKGCKRRECAVKFLKRIGYNVRYNEDNYIKHLEDEDVAVLEIFIGELSRYKGSLSDYVVPLYGFFEEEYSNDHEKLLQYFLGDYSKKITKDNYVDFKKTDKYLEVVEKVNEVKNVYDEIYSEYSEWESKLSFCEKYVLEEQEKENVIYKRKNDEIFEEVFSEFPLAIRNFVSLMSVDEKQEFLGFKTIKYSYDFNVFNSVSMRVLNSSANILKSFVIEDQVEYLRRFGIKIFDNIDFTLEENINKYLQMIDSDEVRDFVPKSTLVDYISDIRVKKVTEAVRESVINRKDFITIMEMFNNNPDNIDFFYLKLSNNQICIHAPGYQDEDGSFRSIMFFPSASLGPLPYYLLHEFGHVIDNKPYGCGFELLDVKDVNPYDPKLRKYEVFNEVLNDIYATEAFEYLTNKGVDLITPKKYVMSDVSDVNYKFEVKKLLFPLVEKFRAYVTRAKICTNPEELVRYIGKDNFEELVDIVNKVSYLFKNDYENGGQYFEELERLRQVYIDIDNYYSDNFGNLESVRER